MQSTNHLISYMLLNSLSDLSTWLCLFLKNSSFPFTDLIFSLRPQGGTVVEIWAYLAFELMQKVFLFLQTTGKKLWALPDVNF